MDAIKSTLSKHDAPSETSELLIMVPHSLEPERNDINAFQYFNIQNQAHSPW